MSATMRSGEFKALRGVPAEGKSETAFLTLFHKNRQSIVQNVIRSVATCLFEKEKSLKDSEKTSICQQRY